MIKLKKLYIISFLLILISFSTSCKDNTPVLVDPDVNSTPISNSDLSLTTTCTPSITSSPTQTKSFDSYGESKDLTQPSSKTFKSPTPQHNNEKIDFSSSKKSVPILYYHCVSDEVYGIPELYVPPKEFEKQMQYLKDNNFDVITFDDLENYESFNKPIILTFDDGYKNNYLEAYPILKKYNFKATIFIFTNFINARMGLSEYEMTEMSDIINFQSHSLTHPNLTKILPDDLERELLYSKLIIENITGKDVTVFAYPTGYYNNEVLDTVKQYYKYAVTIKIGQYKKSGPDYEIKRIYIPRSINIDSFARKVNPGAVKKIK